MDKSERQLDEIEINLQRLPDDAMFKDELIDEYKKLRIEFEANPNVNVTFDFKVRDLAIRVNSYLEGKTKNPIIDKKEEPPVLRTLDSTDEEESIQYAKDKVQIDILSEYVEKVDFEGSIENILAAINLIVQKYESIEIYSRELEQKIAGLKYRMMIKYLELRKIEEAREYSKTFDTDMRIYIVDRLKGKIPELIERGALEEAERINTFVYSDEISTDNLELWEAIVRVETPGWDYRLSEEEKNDTNNLPAVTEKKGLFSRLINSFKNDKKKEDKARKNAIRQEEKEKGLKIFTIKYDPQNPPGYIDMESLKEFYRWVDKNPKKKSKVVFEEGITIIDFPRIGIGRYVRTTYGSFEVERGKGDANVPEFSSSLAEVDIPTTAERIESYTFRGVQALERIDLSKSKIKTIGENAFDMCDLRQIIFPKTLERIEMRAFWLCENLEEIALPSALVEIGEYAFFKSSLQELDVGNTSLTTIREGAFAQSERLRRINFPSCLEKVGKRAFGDTVIERLDLSKTRVKTIPEVMAKNCAKLKTVSFPSDLEFIQDGAFCDSGIEQIDLRNTNVYAIKNHAFCRCRALESFAGSLTMQTLEDDAFEGTPLEHVVRNMIESGIKRTDKCIYPTTFEGIEADESGEAPSGRNETTPRKDVKESVDEDLNLGEF